MVNKMVLPNVCFNRTECTLVFIISWLHPCMLLLHAVFSFHHQYLVFMNLRLYMVPHHLKSVIIPYQIQNLYSILFAEIEAHFDGSVLEVSFHFQIY